MKYFRLASDCFLVDGKDIGAIYDIHKCRIFLLDRQAYKILRKCEDNKPIDYLEKAEINFLKMLQGSDIGYFDSSTAYIDKFLLHQPVDWKGMCMLPPTFFRADWSITNKCDLGCNFCGRNNETISWQSCQTCLRRDVDDSKHWKPNCPEDFVTQISNLGVQVLNIRGGNPLLAWNYLNRVVEAIRATFLDLIITTPGTGRKIKELIDLCSNRRIKLNIVLFGIDKKTTSSVSGQDGILFKQLELIEALIKSKIPFFITFLLTHKSASQRLKILKFVRDKWNALPSFAEIYFRKAIRPGFQLSHVNANSKILSPWRSVEEFFFRVKHNNCMFGNFEISSDGKLRSCAGIHQVHGNIAAEGLHKALSNNNLYEIWRACKGEVQSCKHCLLRFSCADCYTFESEGVKDSKIKTAYCLINPNRDGLKSYGKKWGPKGFIKILSLKNKILEKE